MSDSDDSNEFDDADELGSTDEDEVQRNGGEKISTREARRLWAMAQGASHGTALRIREELETQGYNYDELEEVSPPESSDAEPEIEPDTEEEVLDEQSNDSASDEDVNDRASDEDVEERASDEDAEERASDEDAEDRFSDEDVEEEAEEWSPREPASTWSQTATTGMPRTYRFESSDPEDSD